ncbi:MAG: DUF456 domain-containing protein [Deltaproteobacteria bacterium]|nr:DUF456 domain-containing protein [Deltaproteobacteria bacterium]
MHFVPEIILLLASLVGVALVPLGLPGTWLIFALSFLYSLLWNFSRSSSDFKVLALLFILALMGEILELFVSFWGAKKLQVSTGAFWASLAGGLLGALIGVPVFLIGSLLGLLLGTFLGAFVYEYVKRQSFKNATLSAFAVFFSRMVASFMKTALALGMWVYLLFKV